VFSTDTMIAIPAATVAIGSPETHLDEVAGAQHYSRTWFADEEPVRVVEIAAFAIDRTPVTNAAYAEFVSATGHVTAAERRGYGAVYGRDFWTTIPGICWRHPHPDLDAVTDRPQHPVVHIDHTDATAYAAWAGKRLPSEEEWEYAAHGPHWTAWPWGNDWDSHRANTAEHWAGTDIRDLVAWKSWWQDHYALDGPLPATTVVGEFLCGASPFGLLDATGNVLEWTGSRYRLYDPQRRYDPGYHLAARTGYLAVRGGGWKSFRWQTRTSERIACIATNSAPDLGFRCAQDSPAGPTTPSTPTR
jgi:formylglycine-generating enzyme required for sulfatase activity